MLLLSLLLLYHVSPGFTIGAQYLLMSLHEQKGLTGRVLAMKENYIDYHGIPQG
uniref:Uncharacterized protein n=1 Tax=Octopus bimaculoides TaxID=37653 RepID=A0A0L8G8E5_OCTBM